MKHVTFNFWPGRNRPRDERGYHFTIEQKRGQRWVKLAVYTSEERAAASLELFSGECRITGESK